jgi:pyruvate dehydrogenase E2 component (dihydrolipoamide acetyltransferase)
MPSSLLSGYEPAYDVLPVSNMRKVIARRLMEAKQTVPHFYLTVECDIDRLAKAREQINEQAKGAYKLSVNDFVIKACAQALKRVPEANASWIEDQIYQYKSADVAVAVAIEGGLITPVIRQAETKGLIDISLEMKALAARAREGKLKPEEFQGGTFSLSNLGMYGITQFSAIINPPQGCILAVGAGEERPVIRGGLLTTAMMMTCTLSVDHRVVDGAVGANFLKVFKDLIENPVMMIL